MYWLILISVFGSVFLLIISLFKEKKEEEIKEAGHFSKGEKIEGKTFAGRILNALANKIGLGISKLHWHFLESLRSKIKKQLSMADMVDKNPDYIIASQFLYGLIFSLLGGFLTLIIFGSIKVIVSIGLFILGFILSAYAVKEKIKKRHKSILRSLPDVLDILTVAVEAGLDFNAALIRLIEVEDRKNPLIKEIFQMQQEIYMGRSRIEALQNMAVRVDEGSLSIVCSSLVQAIRMGTSLGPILRLQAEQIRIKRFQKAEKLASEAPVKMLFPLIFLILPTVFLVLFTPLVLTYISSGVEF